jgi:hypothetical protein
MYITSSEYANLTGRNSSEATTERINIACKLLDSRIGNYGTNSSGWKINDNSSIWYVDVNTALTQDQKDAIKLWVSGMITALYNNSNMSQNSNNVRLGRFSVSKGYNSSQNILPDSMGFHDSILVSSGIINRRIDLR